MVLVNPSSSQLHRYIPTAPTLTRRIKHCGGHGFVPGHWNELTANRYWTWRTNLLVSNRTWTFNRCYWTVHCNCNRHTCDYYMNVQKFNLALFCYYIKDKNYIIGNYILHDSFNIKFQPICNYSLQTTIYFKPKKTEYCRSELRYRYLLTMHGSLLTQPGFVQSVNQINEFKSMTNNVLYYEILRKP